MLPGLDFKPLSGGKENRKGNELGSPHQVVEGFSESFFQNFGFGGGRGRQRALACPRSRLDYKPWEILSGRLSARPSLRGKNKAPPDLPSGSSIPIVVPIVIPIVVVPMMGSVPPLPPILIWVPMIAVTRVVLAIVIRSLVSRANVNAKSFIRVRLGGCHSTQTECRQSKEEKSFHINCSVLGRE
jgi:hypothetical protein